MIRPPGEPSNSRTANDWAGVAFTDASEGDVLGDQAARMAVSDQLGIDSNWATLTQVHGGNVVEATGPGNWGEADAIYSAARGLPLAIFTADCAGVVLLGERAVGVAHAGWRGAATGVVAALYSAMALAGHTPRAAAVGPVIGPCCLEVGTEVADRFPGLTAMTTWGTISVDLGAAIAAQLDGLEIWSAGVCTRHEPGWFSHRKDGTANRLAALGWLP
jgi:YfiH family protein